MTNKNNNYASEWIDKLETEIHWRYYWNQQELISNYIKKGDKILEIGVGSKFTSNYLKSKGYDVTTIDIDPKKQPDIVADIVNYTFNEKYDHILAFEIFEHIPFEDFQKALKNISNICNKKLFISLPRNEKMWFKLTLDLKIFQINNFQITTKRNKIKSKYHFWEVDYKNYTKKNILNLFSENKFTLLKYKKFYSLLYFAFEK